MKDLEIKFKYPLTEQTREAARVTIDLNERLLQERNKSAEGFSVLDRVLRTHPEDLGYMVGKEDALDEATRATVYLVRKNHVDDLCWQLITATGPTGSLSTSIELGGAIFVTDIYLSQILKGLRYAFSIEGREDSTKKIVDKGKSDGTNDFLEALSQSDKPLLPYRRRSGAKVMNLLPTYDNKADRGELPTKIRGVTALYVYPNFQNTPTISIAVTRIP